MIRHIVLFLIMIIAISGYVNAIDDVIFINDSFDSYNSSAWVNTSQFKISQGRGVLTGVAGNTGFLTIKDTINLTIYNKLLVVFNFSQSKTDASGYCSIRRNSRLSYMRWMFYNDSTYKEYFYRSTDAYASTTRITPINSWEYRIMKFGRGNETLINGTTGTTYFIDSPDWTSGKAPADAQSKFNFSIDCLTSALYNISIESIIICNDSNGDNICTLPLTPNISILNQTYNCTSCYDNNTIWRNSSTYIAKSIDSTPTVEFNLSSFGNCTISPYNYNFTTMFSLDNSYYCSTPNSITQSCTIPYPLSNGIQPIYIACVYPDGTGGMANSTSGALNISIESANSCSYQTGNWLIQLSDLCNITTNVNLMRNNITINGTGTTSFYSNITNVSNVWIYGVNPLTSIVNLFNGSRWG